MQRTAKRRVCGRSEDKRRSDRGPADVETVRIRRKHVKQRERRMLSASFRAGLAQYLHSPGQERAQIWMRRLALIARPGQARQAA